MDQDKFSQQQDHEYEFLDLSDVDDNERTRLSSALLQQQHDRHCPDSLINDDAAHAKCYLSINSTDDDECQVVLNNNNIQSDFNCTSWSSNATKNSVQTKHFSRLLTRKSQISKQMPKMSPHTNSQQSPIQQPQQQQATQQPTQSQQSPQQQNTQSVNNQQHQQSNQVQSQPQQNTNIPSHSIQSHVYQQQPMQQPQGALALPQNYMQHGGPVVSGSNLYHVLPHMPNLYFSNFTANVNVHGYTQAMQTPYIGANAQSYMSADSHSNSVEQVGYQPHFSEEQQSHAHSKTFFSLQSHQMQSQPPVHIRGSGGRRGRGRGNNNNHRRDFSSRQVNAVHDINQSQASAHIMESQQMIPTSGNYAPPYFVSPYMGIYSPQFTIGHHPSSAAQQAAGTPLYVAGAMPGYGYAYHPGMIYPTMVPMDYPLDDKSDDGMSTENGASMMSQQWQVEYSQLPIDSNMHQQSDEFAPHQQQQQPQQPSQTPADEFNSQQTTEEFARHQPSEFIPQQHEYLPQQQHQPEIVTEFIPRPEFVYGAQPIDHHSPQLTSPVFKPQEDNSFQTFPPEFIPGNQPINIQHSHVIESKIVGDGSEELTQQVAETKFEYLAQDPNSIDPFNNNNIDFKAKEFEEKIEQSIGNAQVLNLDGTSAADAYSVESKKNNNGGNSSSTDNTNSSCNNNRNNQAVPNNKAFVNIAQKTSSNTNSIDSNSGNLNASAEVLARKPSTTTTECSINGLVQATNDKLSIKNERVGTNKNPATSAWTPRKSTQSVAVSVVPSNNYPQSEPTQAKISNQTNKVNLSSNSNGGGSNNNSAHITSIKPIVPKVDEQQPSTTSALVNTCTEKLHSDTTSQSSEVQTIPVSEIDTEIVINASVARTTSPQPTIPAVNQPTASASSWASLFTKPASNLSESQKKPVAKVMPYNSTHNESKATNVPTPVTPTVPTAPGTLSYSATSSQKVPNLASSSTSLAKKAAPVKARIAPSSKGLSSPSASESQQFDEFSHRLGDFILKYKVDNNAISLRPRGLTNRSNYCYMNAILQALVACPPFYNLMKSIPMDQPAFRFKTKTPTIDAVVELVREFSNLPNGSRLQRRDKGGNKKEDVTCELVCDPSIEPTAIHKLWNSTRTDNEGRQEDAEEFLGYVLNKLNDEMLELKKLVEKPVAAVNETVANGVDINGESADDEGDEWQLIGTKNKGTVTRSTDFGRTPLSDIFRGELRSRLQREGDHSTDVLQPFFTLQLNIEKANSVKEALENFVNKDQLEGVTCTKTNQEVNAWQQMTLEKLPIVLILHLKLFDYKGDVCTKILKTVEFPIELKLDSKILSSKKYNTKQKQYRLFAVVYHDGKEASKGHYITDVYHTGYLNWIRYDDSTVKRVSERTVLHPHSPRVPYLLYYRRIDTLTNSNNTNMSNNTK